MSVIGLGTRVRHQSVPEVGGVVMSVRQGTADEMPRMTVQWDGEPGCSEHPANSLLLEDS